ncbi:MAG TPA: Gfo/Idh/MocA family oxidoreductase [Thermoanaerobaculia bacterium]|nr:Gfo/Idh/MocA family oxidoreductase [Thermoanaerobaculia bacterium]
MSDPLRFGLVGAGRIADCYAQVFEKSEWARVAGIADVRPEAAGALAGRLGCPAFDSCRSMSADCALDAVVVCTPPATHPEIARHFLRRQIHVLCEKPLSIDFRSARLMAHEALRSGAILTLASKFRFVEDVVRARRLVESGAIGGLVLAENSFTARTDMSARWNSNPALSGGGVLIDNGTHSVDLMRFFLGPLVDVQIVEGPRTQGLAVEETVRLFVRNLDGVLGSIDLSWSLGKEAESYLTLYGTEGVLTVGWKESRYRRASNSDWISFGTGYDKVEAFRSQIENFTRAIRGEDVLRVGIEDALASVEVIEAAYRALHGSRWTAVGADRLRRSRNLSLVALVAGGRG